MKIKALLIEDEAPARKTIKSYLKKYFPRIEVVHEIDNEKEAIEHLNQNDYDLIFLDVQLKNGTGVDVLQKVENKDMRIIFTTAFEDYALEAFQHKAFGYLLKPLNPLDFKEIVHRVIKDIDFVDTTAKKVKVTTKKGSSYINIDTIVRCESDSNYTHFYCDNSNSYMISKTLKYVQEKLIDSIYFVRIHQSHLVNVKFIDPSNISARHVLLRDGTKLPVSRSRKPHLVKVLSTKILA